MQLPGKEMWCGFSFQAGFVSRIRLDRLTYSYPGAAIPTLQNLDLTVAQGEAHALLGASGSGKTTLLNLLSGLLHPTSGAIYFDDRDVSALPGRQRDVAQVFQFPVLYESLSVADNLAFPLRQRQFSRKQIDERIDYICAELEIEKLRSAKPRGLSLFEKQLVAVGKALARPDLSLVLLDEPLTAVEPKIKWQLRQTLRKVQADLGVTMIYVTHDQTEALTFADRVSVLTVDGILQSDTPEQLYAAPAHEYVGHFVGSPGMNFIPAAVLAIGGGDRIGFRPEWATLISPLLSSGNLPGEVKRVRVQGTRSGEPYGLVTCATPYGELSVRTTLVVEGVQVTRGQKLAIAVQRFVIFADGKRVA